MDNNNLNIAHAYVMSKLYDEYSKDNKPVVLQLEDGNQEHADTISLLVDMGYIHVLPDRNLLLVHLTDEGLSLMKAVEKYKGIIQ